MLLVDLSRSVPIFCGCFLGLVPTGAEGEASMFYRATKAEASESGSEARLRVRLVGHRKREDLFGCVPNQVIELLTLFLPLSQRRCSHEVDCSHDAVRDPEEKQCRLCIFELDELADCRVEPAKQFLLDKRGGEGVVAQGTPNIWISDVGTSLTWSSSLTPSSWIGQGRSQLSSSQLHSHFEGFRCRPKAGPRDLRISHAFERSSTSPTMPPSSMYHLLYTGPSSLIWFTRHMRPQQKYKGPKGSPCCTPELDSIMCLWSYNNIVGDPKHHSVQDDISGNISHVDFTK